MQSSGRDISGDKGELRALDDMIDGLDMSEDNTEHWQRHRATRTSVCITEGKTL